MEGTNTTANNDAPPSYDNVSANPPAYAPSYQQQQPQAQTQPQPVQQVQAQPQPVQYAVTQPQVQPQVQMQPAQGQMMAIQQPDGTVQYVMAMPAAAAAGQPMVIQGQLPGQAGQQQQAIVTMPTQQVIVPQTQMAMQTQTMPMQMQVQGQQFGTNMVHNNNATFAEVGTVGNFNPDVHKNPTIASNGIQSVNLATTATSGTGPQSNLPSNMSTADYQRATKQRRERLTRRRRIKAILMIILGLILMVCVIISFWFLVFGLILFVWGVIWLFNCCPGVCGFGSRNSSRIDE